MTDEEMAEQYAQNLEKELMKEYEEHSEYGQTAYLATIPTLHAKQAFLAGLKAGRPQWHDLRKDPNDLPKDEKDVQVLYQDCDKLNTYNCVYDIHAENWLYYNLDSMVLELFTFNVIAWCEIPTFDKE